MKSPSEGGKTKWKHLTKADSPSGKKIHVPAERSRIWGRVDVSRERVILTGVSGGYRFPRTGRKVELGRGGGGGEIICKGKETKSSAFTGGLKKGKGESCTQEDKRYCKAKIRVNLGGGGKGKEVYCRGAK